MGSRHSRKDRDENWQRKPAKTGSLPVGGGWIHGGPDRLEHPRWTPEERERGPVTVRAARGRARTIGLTGSGRGVWAGGSRLRKQIKKTSVFKDKAPKKTREKKRGRR